MGNEKRRKLQEEEHHQQQQQKTDRRDNDNYDEETTENITFGSKVQFEKDIKHEIKESTKVATLEEEPFKKLKEKKEEEENFEDQTEKLHQGNPTNSSTAVASKVRRQGSNSSTGNNQVHRNTGG